MIEVLRAREILDSRGNPTLEVDVFGPAGLLGRASAPAGASKGTHEAVERRDGDPQRYGGKGVLAAVRTVHEIVSPALAGRSPMDQAEIDRTLQELDGTENFSRLGGNTAIAVSLAVAHAGARAQGLPLHRWFQELAGVEQSSLPLPMVNMISGGLHAGGRLDIQDFLVIPVGAASLRQAIEWVVGVREGLARVLARAGLEASLVADEGGFGPSLSSNGQALDLLLAAIEESCLEPGRQMSMALDVASTHFFRNGRYHFRLQPGATGDLDSDAMIEQLARWVERYPIISIEDGLAEDDWAGWQRLTAALGQRVQLVGDDLLVTSPARLARAIEGRYANAILVKPNQIGTVSETLRVLRQAWDAGFRTIVSARSGETEDTTIADLAVGSGAGQIKIGSVTRGERLCKYNQLLRIEEELGSELAWVARPDKGVANPGTPFAESGRATRSALTPGGRG